MADFIFSSAIIIDDSTVDNLIHKKMLTNYGIVKNVECFNNPLTAISYFEEIVSSSSLPELILVDVRMPKMSGYEVVSKLETVLGSKIENTSIYMLSASLDPEEREKVLSVNTVNDLLIKPLTQKSFSQFLDNKKDNIQE